MHIQLFLTSKHNGGKEGDGGFLFMDDASSNQQSPAGHSLNIAPRTGYLPGAHLRQCAPLAPRSFGNGPASQTPGRRRTNVGPKARAVRVYINTRLRRTGSRAVPTSRLRHRDVSPQKHVESQQTRHVETVVL